MEQKFIKQVQRYCLDTDGNKIDIGSIEYTYDEQQRLQVEKNYDHSDRTALKITTVVYDNDGNEVVRKTDTMREVGFSLSWNISTYDENGKLIEEEGCFDGEDEKYETVYHYDENGDLSESVWTKGDYTVCTKYRLKDGLYESISDKNFKIVITKKLKNVLTERKDDEGNVIYKDLHEDFDEFGKPTKHTIFRAENGTTITELYKRDENGNLLEKNVYISVGDIENMLLSTEVREIEYYE
ncbi:hypothetical protein FACS1894201_03120 [Bacteroidia bacterium]|nr:hypothetical protein FACS1894201_03120 [Bacteroidia bacterium]